MPLILRKSCHVSVRLPKRGRHWRVWPDGILSQQGRGCCAGTGTWNWVVLWRGEQVRYEEEWEEEDERRTEVSVDMAAYRVIER